MGVGGVGGGEEGREWGVWVAVGLWGWGWEDRGASGLCVGGHGLAGLA